MVSISVNTGPYMGQTQIQIEFWSMSSVREAVPGNYLGKINQTNSES